MSWGGVGRFYILIQKRASVMRIMIVTDQYPPMVGGVPRVTHDLAVDFANRGHQVWVVAQARGHVMCGVMTKGAPLSLLLVRVAHLRRAAHPVSAIFALAQPYQEKPSTHHPYSLARGAGQHRPDSGGWARANRLLPPTMPRQSTINPSLNNGSLNEQAIQHDNLFDLVTFLQPL